MFTNPGATYDVWDASLEILVMLLGAFLLGMLVSYLLIRSHHKKKNTSLIDKTEEFRPKRSIEDIRASFRKAKSR